MKKKTTLYSKHYMKKIIEINTKFKNFFFKILYQIKYK